MPSKFSRTGAGTGCAALVVLAVMAWSASGAPACGCGELRGPVVAKGKSLYGVPWRIKAALARSRGSQPRTIEVHFLIGRKGEYTGVGHFTYLGLPLHPAFVLTANEGREINEYPEGNVSGVTRRDVWTLTIEMSDGESLNVQPTLAPRPLLRRFRWLRGLRFFDVFFSADQKPKIITVFDHHGRVLARYSNHRGIFRR